MSRERLEAIKRGGRRLLARLTKGRLPERPYTQLEPILLTSNFRPEQFQSPLPDPMEEDGSMMRIGEGSVYQFSASNVTLRTESPAPLYYSEAGGSSYPFEVILDLFTQAQFVLYQIKDRRMAASLDRNITALREAVKERPHLKPTALVTE